MNRRSDRLPQGWKWAKLGDVCEVILGQSPPSSTYRKIPEGLPFFQGKADFGDISPNPTTWCVEPKKVAEAGDVLISMRAPVGPTNIANTRCCIGRGLAAIRCRNEADRDFVLAGLKLYESDISSMGTGSLFNAITGKQLKEFVFPLPPLPEQKCIAALLNQQMAYVEKARKAAEEMLEAAQALPGAFLRQAFPAHGEALPAGWQWTKLGDVCKVNPRRPTGFDWDPHTKTTFVPMPSVDGQTGAITQPQERNYAEVSRGYTYFEEGDVLFAKITPCMQNGKHAIASGLGNGFGFGSTEFHVLRPSGAVLSEWVHKFLRQPSVLAEAVHHFRGSVGQQRVPKEFLTYLPIPLPPLTEQKRIAALLKEQMAYVETVRMSAREQLDAINALPAALLRRAFAGTL